MIRGQNIVRQHLLPFDFFQQKKVNIFASSTTNSVYKCFERVAEYDWSKKSIFEPKTVVGVIDKWNNK
jgi:hypothetical protein